MHASMAFLNGAGSLGHAENESPAQQLQLLNALLGTSATSSGGKSLDEGKSRDENKADDESAAPSISRPDGFKNDPDDSTNPNEVRERHLREVKKS